MTQTTTVPRRSNIGIAGIGQGGGGIPWRQGPHRIDLVRLLGGGILRSVRSMTGDWMRERPIAGYHRAHLEFEDGRPAEYDAELALPPGQPFPVY